jgi:hypothetical protein
MRLFASASSFALNRNGIAVFGGHLDRLRGGVLLVRPAHREDITAELRRRTHAPVMSGRLSIKERESRCRDAPRAHDAERGLAVERPRTGGMPRVVSGELGRPKLDREARRETLQVTEPVAAPLATVGATA